MDLLWRRSMPVNLSIKNVPDGLAERLRERAERNRRSLQKELLVILEEAAATRIRPHEALERVRALGLRTPGESTRLIREMRNAR
jgi:plasmid stability protein